MGCPFHPRCPEVIPGRCDVETPAPLAAGAIGAACFRVEDAAA
jgi:peptide/nickel transport system ATP-binding protein